MQARELLNYEGHPREILATPLTGCDRLVPEFGGSSTGCHRGYIGTWEFRDDTLHLVRLESPISSDGRNRLWGMFPGAGGSVEAVWFSGELVADDVAHPNDSALFEFRAENEITAPLHFTAFVAVVRLGKLLLETVTDLEAGVTRSRLTRHAEELFPGEEFAFLRTIQADPNDVTAKLVYADWLEDRDDPRGPVLRAQAREQERDGPRPPRVEYGKRVSLPTGYVPPGNAAWFWCQLAGVPEPAREEL